MVQILGYLFSQTSTTISGISMQPINIWTAALDDSMTFDDSMLNRIWMIEILSINCNLQFILID